MVNHGDYKSKFLSVSGLNVTQICLQLICYYQSSVI